jgi:hypothetical protein
MRGDCLRRQPQPIISAPNAISVFFRAGWRLRRTLRLAGFADFVDAKAVVEASGMINAAASGFEFDYTDSNKAGFLKVL